MKYKEWLSEDQGDFRTVGAYVEKIEENEYEYHFHLTNHHSHVNISHFIYSKETYQSAVAEINRIKQVIDKLYDSICSISVTELEKGDGNTIKEE
jgi:hypothetical protein